MSDAANRIVRKLWSYCKVQDPAKLRRLIVELIGREDWSGGLVGDGRRRAGQVE